MRSFIILASLISLPAFACPNLAGKYATCQSTTGQSEGSTDITVTQKVTNNITTYKMQLISAEEEEVEEIYIADGRVKTETISDEETGLTLKTNTTSSCNGSTLNVKLVAFMNNEEMANMNVKITKANGKITQVVSGVSMGQRVSDTIVCE